MCRESFSPCGQSERKRFFLYLEGIDAMGKGEKGKKGPLLIHSREKKEKRKALWASQR